MFRNYSLLRSPGILRFELKNNEHTTYENIWGITKVVIRMIFLLIQLVLDTGECVLVAWGADSLCQVHSRPREASTFHFSDYSSSFHYFHSLRLGQVTAAQSISSNPQPELMCILCLYLSVCFRVDVSGLAQLNCPLAVRSLKEGISLLSTMPISVTCT